MENDLSETYYVLGRKMMEFVYEFGVFKLFSAFFLDVVSGFENERTEAGDIRRQRGER